MIISAAKALALTRIAVGLYFLSYAWDKTAKNWLSDGTPLTNQLLGNPNATPPTPGFARNSEAFYRAFLESTMPTHGLLISQLVTIGEWVTGILLVLGLLTRLGSLTGMWLTLNYILLKGIPTNAVYDRVFFVALLGCLLASAGLVWGLDGVLSRQLAGNPITRWLAGLPAEAEKEERLERVPAG